MYNIFKEKYSDKLYSREIDWKSEIQRSLDPVAKEYYEPKDPLSTEAVESYLKCKLKDIYETQSKSNSRQIQDKKFS